jgi:hypothetical protein
MSRGIKDLFYSNFPSEKGLIVVVSKLLLYLYLINYKRPRSSTHNSGASSISTDELEEKVEVIASNRLVISKLLLYLYLITNNYA